MNKHDCYIGTGELASFFRARGIDCTRNSRQLREDLGDLFGCGIPLKTMVLSALLAGFACIPNKDGAAFTFCRVSQ